MAEQQANTGFIYPAAEVVGNAFVNQYYQVVRAHPNHAFKFYQECSKIGRPESDGQMSCTTSMDGINKKILSFHYDEFKAEIKTVDSQESLEQSVIVLVTGIIYGKDNIVRNFTQTFFLAPQEKGFYVLNDVFRFVDDPVPTMGNGFSDQPSDLPLQEASPASVPEADFSEALPVQTIENDDQPETFLEVEAEVEEPFVQSDQIESSAVEEESPPSHDSEVAPDETQPVSEVVPMNQEDDLPKKSYASIVKENEEKKAHHTKQISTTQESSPKSSKVPKASPVVVDRQLVVTKPVSSGESTEPVTHAKQNSNVENHSGSDGCSIYIKNLPLNATPEQLEEEFKKFGPIKSGGVQVRSNRMQGFCYGFVEFQSSSSMLAAKEASQVIIGGKNAFVEEKRPTSGTRAARGRYPPRGGFRNDGGRGRGAYGGRGYGRSEFSNSSDTNRGDVSRGDTSRGDYSGRGRGGRGGRGSSNEGYQRVDQYGNGNRVSRPKSGQREKSSSN